MDLTMPELNGLDATRCIVRDAPSVRVIAVSAHRGTPEKIALPPAAMGRGFAGHFASFEFPRQRERRPV